MAVHSPNVSSNLFMGKYYTIEYVGRLPEAPKSQRTTIWQPFYPCSAGKSIYM